MATNHKLIIGNCMDIKEGLFKGNKYNFEILYEELNKNKYSWTLKAICKKTNHYSGINNLNPVLSELGVNGDIINRRFKDDKLDEDRAQGEWENV